MKVESKTHPGWLLDVKAGTAERRQIVRISESGRSAEFTQEPAFSDLAAELRQLRADAEAEAADADEWKLPDGWERSTHSDDSFVAMCRAFEVYPTSTGVRLRTPGKPSVPVPDVIEAALAVARRNNATLPKWLWQADLLKEELDQKVARIAELERELEKSIGLQYRREITESQNEDAKRAKARISELERELQQRTEHEAADAARIAELEEMVEKRSAGILALDARVRKLEKALTNTERHRNQLRDAMHSTAISLDEVARAVLPTPEVKSPWPLRFVSSHEDPTYLLEHTLTDTGLLHWTGGFPEQYDHTQWSDTFNGKILSAARAADANPEFAPWREQSGTSCVEMLQGWIGGGK